MSFNAMEYQGNGLWTQHVMDAHGDVYRIVVIGFGNPDPDSRRGDEPQYRRYRVRVDNHELEGDYAQREDATQAAYEYVGRSGTRSR